MFHRYGVCRSRMQWAMWVCMLLFAGHAAAQSPAAGNIAKATPKTVLVMGDSLSAGYGIAASQG